MRKILKVSTVIAVIAVIAIFILVIAAVNAINENFAMERPGGEKICGVVGLTNGHIGVGTEGPLIWLECPGMTRKHAIAVPVSDPRAFQIGGRAACSLHRVFGAIMGDDKTQLLGRLSDCKPMAALRIGPALR